MKLFGYFFQLVGLLLLPCVLLWSFLGHVDARAELALLCIGAGVFYLGTILTKEKS